MRLPVREIRVYEVENDVMHVTFTFLSPLRQRYMTATLTGPRQQTSISVARCAAYKRFTRLWRRWGAPECRVPWLLPEMNATLHDFAPACQKVKTPGKKSDKRRGR